MKTYSITCGIGFDRHGEPLTSENVENVIRVASRKACEWFGGVSVIRGAGGWVSPSGAFTSEPFARFEIIAPDRSARKVRDLRDYLKTLLSQESVLLTVREETVL